MGQGVDSCSLPPTLEALLPSKFSTNCGWSPDLKTGLATLGQGLAKVGSANPG